MKEKARVRKERGERKRICLRGVREKYCVCVRRDVFMCDRVRVSNTEYVHKLIVVSACEIVCVCVTMCVCVLCLYACECVCVYVRVCDNVYV